MRLMPLTQPGECALRKVTQPKCKVNIRPIYNDPYEIYECITESYSANCTYGNYEPVCIPTNTVPKRSVNCKGCFINKEDLLNRCERDGVPNDEVYECSDNQVNVISDVIEEEKENETEGISQRNTDDCLINSSQASYPFIFVYILLLMML